MEWHRYHGHKSRDSVTLKSMRTGHQQIWVPVSEENLVIFDCNCCTPRLRGFSLCHGYSRALAFSQNNPLQSCMSCLGLGLGLDLGGILHVHQHHDGPCVVHIIVHVSPLPLSKKLMRNSHLYRLVDTNYKPGCLYIQRPFWCRP